MGDGERKHLYTDPIIKKQVVLDVAAINHTAVCIWLVQVCMHSLTCNTFLHKI